jgi:alkylation response protein AidB-like acyl-CoA dehydrogenase
MDFELTDEQRLLRETTRKLMQRHAPPDEVRRLDREREYPYTLYEEWVNAGLLRLPFPEEFGGLGGSVTDVVLVAEEIAHTSADLMMAYGGNIFCGLNILRNGSADQTLASQAHSWRSSVFRLHLGTRCRIRRRRNPHQRCAA